MSATTWNSASVKTLLRRAAQTIGILQERKDSQAAVVRRDVATLLSRRDVVLARAKAQNLMLDEFNADLLENLEMQLGILLEHFSELEQGFVNSPVVVEAVSTLIFAGASQPDCRELISVRELLIQRLGPDFARSAISNRDNHVSARVVHAMNAPPPTAAGLDMFMLEIAKTYNVAWMPEPRRQDIVRSISEILNPDTPPAVDINQLRLLCARGIPDDPPWLRPRLWRLFLNTLPVLKSTWGREAHQQRLSYYDLVRRVLKPFSELPDPTLPLSPLDTSLLGVSRQIARIPSNLCGGLDAEPDHSPLCPLDEKAAEDIKITYADILDTRLQAIHALTSQPSSSIPEIRLEADAPSSPPPTSLSERRPVAPSITLLTSQTGIVGDMHPRHTSALSRILYLHSTINPGNLSPHIPALLVPLYVVLNQEIEVEELSHVEADTFWLFEAMIGEFAELEEEDGGSIWMRKLGERLSWADSELSESLQVKGLDPSLPHYSYRWMAPLLTQTLPLSSVLVVWDALFSCAMRERSNSPKLEYLLDICTAMLIRARAALFRLGKGGHRSPSLWGDESNTIPPPSPLRAWEFGDAFMEGMTLLQQYPLEAAGGVDRLLQTASDLAYRRMEESKNATPANVSLGERLRTTMWRGFTNQLSPEPPSPEESDDTRDEEYLSKTEDEETTADESPAASGLGARLANTVWRGITNKSSMEPPPTPISPMMPPSPIGSPWPSSKEPASPPETPVATTLWNYAEKLKDSDAAARFSKVSSNWRARAMLGSWVGRSPNSTQSTPQNSPPTQSLSSPEFGYPRRLEDGRHASLPIMGATENYSPPARPAFFRPPRDSFIGPPSPRPSSPPTSPPWSPQSEGGFLSRTRNLQESLSALTRKTPEPAPKSGPRPLLLNSSSLVATTPRPQHQSRQESISEATQLLADPQWQHIPRGMGHSLRQDSISQSSTSSLSPLDVNGRGWKASKAELNQLNPDVNIPSRRVALNRRSISPMAPISRIRPTSNGSSPDRILLSPSAPAPETDSDTTESVKLPPNKLGLTLQQSEDTTDSERPVVSPIISPRLRSKRYGSRPANIRTEDLALAKTIVDQRPSPQTLNVEWPEQNETTVTTPKATTFEHGSPISPGRNRKMSGDGQEPRVRKISGGQRARKTSTGTIRATNRAKRESAAEEGDDEGGYDELLSAYESEDGVY
ncbi:DUF292-domain-containing protein [Mycena indigotica]|uniref:DUF292-domain-containing protein n=1 Tax=Mycena indigotica TaxID=2126181 RepID=A0A8H6SBY2_9AGAR|nr:DUF292-domain-containing protein [Mycena indigotica]KAF7295030.1 DUF292-domain-containing protein [Mycena indigotica]